MALKDKGRCYRTVASGGGSLTPPDNESWRLVNAYCVASTNDTYLTLSVGGRTVNKIRVAGKTGNHVPYPNVGAAAVYPIGIGTIFDLARRIGRPLDIPIAHGETLSVARYAEAGELTLVYDAYDEGDVLSTEPNGSHSEVLRFLHYLDNSAAVTAAVASMDSSLIWSSGETWPILSEVAAVGPGKVVPLGKEIEILGILGAPAARGNASANKGATTYLVLRHNGIVLFDPLNGIGLPMVGNTGQTADAVIYTAVASVVGPMTAAIAQPPFIPPDPLVFRSGDTLSMSFSTTGAASGGIAASQLDLAFLEELRPAA
jgi:hypothetical protein